MPDDKNRTPPPRDEKGRLLKGAVLNPGGVTEIDRTLHGEFARLCRSILEGKDQEGRTLFERTVETLMEPVIEEKSAGGPKYLVNGNVILACLEFLTKRGYGREPDPKDEKKHGRITVVIRAEQPEHRGMTPPKQLGPVAIKTPPGTE